MRAEFNLFLILAMDLNLTMLSYEVWGFKASFNPLFDNFIQLFDGSNPLDVLPTKIFPTYMNGKKGNASIGKRLDIFLITENLVGSVDRLRSLVVNLLRHI